MLSNGKPKFLNWSSITLLATVAGIVVPIWIWRADLSSKSLEFRVASQASLEPSKSGDIKGLQITLDAAPLDRPYLTVVELTNDGSKPILSSEFEGPVEFRLSSGTKIVRAQLISANPKSLEAKVATTDSSIAVAPLLLNPEDKLTISILTSGGPPWFSPHARIAGVTEIKHDDRQEKVQPWRLSLLALLAAFLLILASDLTSVGFPNGKPVVLHRRDAIFVSCVTGATGMSMFLMFLRDIGVQSWGQIVLAFITLMLVTSMVAVIWTIRPKNSKIGSHDSP